MKFLYSLLFFIFFLCGNSSISQNSHFSFAKLSSNKQFDNSLPIEASRLPVVLGFKTGIGMSTIREIPAMIIPEPFFINYNIEDKDKKIPVYSWLPIGAFIEYGDLSNQQFVLGLDFLYSRQYGKFSFVNYEKDFQYDMDFKYDYLNSSLYVKWHPWASENIGNKLENIGFAVGYQFGYNLTPDGLFYDSKGTSLPAFGTDAQQEQQLRNVIIGKNNQSLVLGVSFFNNRVRYEGESGLNYFFDGKVLLGFSDVIETRANSYNFNDTWNTNFNVQITGGIFF